MPCYMYGPKGEAQVFASASDAPTGWKDTPPTIKEGDSEAARRNADIPPGRHDRAALPPALAVIADQVLAETMARVSPPPTPDERPVAYPYNPLDHIERVGDPVIPAPAAPEVVTQGDKQPHYEATNWKVSDQIKAVARIEGAEAKARAEAQVSAQVDQTNAAADAKVKELGGDPTLTELIADGRLSPEELKGAVEPADIAKVVAEAAAKEPPKPQFDPLDRDEDGKKGGSKPKAAKK